MIPSISSVRSSSVAELEPFVRLEVGILHGRSLSGQISYDPYLEGSQINRSQARLIARRESSQIVGLASRIFREFREEVQPICILDISSRGISDSNLRRIVSSLLNTVLNISPPMEDDEDEFRSSTPPPAAISDPGRRTEFFVNGLLETPPKPLSMRRRDAMIDDSSVACSYELSRAALDRPALRSLAQPRVTDQPPFPPRDFSLHAGSEVTPPAQLPRAAAIPPVLAPASPNVRLPLFADDYLG